MQMFIFHKVIQFLQDRSNIDDEMGIKMTLKGARCLYKHIYSEWNKHAYVKWKNLNRSVTRTIQDKPYA